MHSTRLISLIILVSITFPVTTNAQKGGKTELTTTDIFKTGQLDGAQLSVFGFYLGMKKAEARKLLHSNKKLNVDDITMIGLEKPHLDSAEFGFYVYDLDTMTGERRKDGLLFLGWVNGNPGLARITVFNNFADHAVEETCRLFSSDVVTSRSSLYKKFFAANGATATTDHRFDLRTWFYPSRNIMIIENTSKKPTRHYFQLTKKESLNR